MLQIFEHAAAKKNTVLKIIHTLLCGVNFSYNNVALRIVQCEVTLTIVCNTFEQKINIDLHLNLMLKMGPWV